MNTIENKVAAAMQATSRAYYYSKFIFDSDPWFKAHGLRCRTLAVVKHDRYLNGRK